MLRKSSSFIQLRPNSSAQNGQRLADRFAFEYDAKNRMAYTEMPEILF